MFEYGIINALLYLNQTAIENLSSRSYPVSEKHKIKVSNKKLAEIYR
jgi:hypothetical protein